MAVAGTNIISVLRIILFWLLTISTTSSGDENPSMREAKFEAYKNFTSDETLCSTDTPMLIQNKVRSRIQCTLLCRDDPSCAGVNWKEPSTCELFTSPAATLQTVAGCTYWSKQFIFESI